MNASHICPGVPSASRWTFRRWMRWRWQIIRLHKKKQWRAESCYVCVGKGAFATVTVTFVPFLMIPPGCPSQTLISIIRVFFRLNLRKAPLCWFECTRKQKCNERKQKHLLSPSVMMIFKTRDQLGPFGIFNWTKTTEKKELSEQLASSGWFRRGMTLEEWFYWSLASSQNH